MLHTILPVFQESSEDLYYVAHYSASFPREQWRFALCYTLFCQFYKKVKICIVPQNVLSVFQESSEDLNYRYVTHYSASFPRKQWRFILCNTLFCQFSKEAVKICIMSHTVLSVFQKSEDLHCATKCSASFPRKQWRFKLCYTLFCQFSKKAVKIYFMTHTILPVFLESSKDLCYVTLFCQFS